MAVLDKPLTNVQLELLKLYSLNVSENQLLEIKKVLAKYFANTATLQMDKLWIENNWTNETMENWLKEK
jgi:hypothetical protein